MATNDSKRDARAAYKDRTPDSGIFLFRAPDGAGWVGYAPELAAAENRLSFTLRMGSARPFALQKAWNDRDGQGFTFEVLERPDEDLPDVARPRWASDSVMRWAEKLGAARL